jgi:RNA polymerase sigma factor (sigma-70 family)
MMDGELLEAFRTLGDQDAFTALMRRHGQMVHGAARAMVGDAAVAEDVAQATFLALARKAGLLEGADSVAGWLYHVALCLARNEYRAQVRRKAREEEAAMIATDPDSGTFAEGVVSTLYEELGKLAEKYRQPVILHHLEGLSYEAAAPMCGCTEKAFSMRLTRGREQLRERLAKRGVALGITALVAGLGQSAASAAELPAALVASTCKAATGVAAGGSVAGGGLVSAKVAALTDSALKLLFWAQVKTVAAVCAGIAVLGGAGVTLATVLSHPPQQEARPAAVVAPALPAASNAAATAEYEDGAILFQDSFEEGLGKWNLYTTKAGALNGTIAANSPDIRLVKGERDGKAVTVVELVGREPGGLRVGIATKPFGGGMPDAFTISYEYTCEDRPRRAMEGLAIGDMSHSPHFRNGAFTQPALPPGQWNQVRWECERRTDAQGAQTITASLIFNGERLGSAEYPPPPGGIGLELTVIEGQFRFANVTIREMKKER